MEKFLRTQEVAKICQVAQGTVIRWINEGRLRASSTMGGHNRIQAKDVVELLKNMKLPVPAQLLPESAESPKRVLVVDDEVEIRKMIRWILERDFPGIEVEEADGGFVAGWKTHSFKPNLVILDLMLPGLNGFQVCEFIRQFAELADTKILAISGLIDPVTTERILKLGANDFVAKPFIPENFSARVAAQLSGNGNDLRGEAA